MRWLGSCRPITIGVSTGITKKMDLGSIGGRMELFTKDNSSMMSSKVRDLCFRDKGSRSKPKTSLSKIDKDPINLMNSNIFFK